jgi:hypothetical protein
MPLDASCDPERETDGIGHATAQPRPGRADDGLGVASVRPDPGDTRQASGATIGDEPVLHPSHQLVLVAGQAASATREPAQDQDAGEGEGELRFDARLVHEEARHGPVGRQWSLMARRVFRRSLTHCSHPVAANHRILRTVRGNLRLPGAARQPYAVRPAAGLILD